MADAHHAGLRPSRAHHLGRNPLPVIDEVGYSPSNRKAANLFSQLVSSRYERSSLGTDQLVPGS
jgi:DNA replication protein DnaC